MKLALGLAAFGLLLIAPAQAQTPANTMGVACLYTSTPPTITNNQFAAVRCDSAGNLIVTGGGGSSTPATGTGGQTAYTAGTTSAQAVAAGTRTAMLYVQNESTTASIAVSLGGTAALNTAGSWMIGPGQLFVFSSAAYVPGDAVNIIASAAATPVTIFAK